MGHALRTNFKIKTDSKGNPMIYLWRSEDRTSVGTEVTVEIDNRRCAKTAYSECFQSVNQAAKFLTASLSQKALDTSFPIKDIRSSTENESTDTAANIYPNMTYVVIGVIVIILLGLFIGVLVAQRKHAKGITWFPEGFLKTSSGQHRQSRRRGPDGQEMRNLHKQTSVQRVDVDTNDNSTVSPGTSGWSDDDMGDHPPMKRMRSSRTPDPTHGDTNTATEFDSTDPRQWTKQHLDAADVRNPNVHAQTPPQAEELEPGNVNVRGPGGLTPLMLASFRGGVQDSVDDVEEDESSVNMIQDLLSQGAKINMITDCTGETSLHLAARYARADAAKRLLDAGNDANVQDNTGRAPLHAAIAADAQGVFQILLRNRATNLNCRMYDGTTPLILAARLAIEGMVEDLVSADADINAADDLGKTALHWAAAVNNVDAVRVLLIHGANRDAQDNKEETPLFLAAREGAYQAAQILLEHFANREITDHMDRLPRDVAVERMHNDIVKLLDDFVPQSPHMSHMLVGRSVDASSPTMISPPTAVASTRSNKSKKRLKANNMVGMASLMDSTNISSNNDGGIRRKSSVKKRKEPPPPAMPGMDGTVTMSPVNSLESPHTTGCMDGTPSPHDTNIYSGHTIALPHSNLAGLDSTCNIPNKQPPLYSDFINNSSQLYGLVGGMDQNGQTYVNRGMYPYLQTNSQTVKPQHPRQSSVPSSVTAPLSYTVSSPIKQRPSLPTSPTHMAAMRAAHHQKAAQIQSQQQSANNIYDNSTITELQQMLGQQPLMSGSPQVPYQHTFQYPTPPSQHSQHSSEATPQHYLLPPETYLTPSPESPGQWSSSSPYSAQSDWSEGISSPTGPINLQHLAGVEQHQSQQSTHNQQEAVFI
ncbi:neurogenic locus Notch protein-like [Limulus polyphemus]|uniref:Neurogenic locus Notch protein-like n=1 Tax=Limulus polyphemus TaxID=6850 RepID=A0ABM1B7N3_LIMPO|nr:neurogenic locus Notch protein-like [Limulus polyphemus]